MEKREIIKRLSALPFVNAMYPLESTFAYQTQRQPSASAQNIYQQLGVEPVINCRGTFTIIGGSIERPEVLAAKSAASHNFVQLDELAMGVGQRLADLTGAEWGMVSSGCAGGMKHVTAACVTGGNPELLVRIPDLTGFEKTEVVSPSRSRNTYDSAVRNVGITMITVDTPEEMEKALSSRTAMIYLTSGDSIPPDAPFSYEQIARMAKPRNIPILVDAAAQDLTWKPNIHLQRGVDVVAYSGGKALCGPQSAGLILGRKDILLSAWQASSPHHGPGRDNKVDKSEMIGMVAAVEAWVNRDHAAKERTWRTWLENISRRLTAINGVTCVITDPTGLGNRSPRITVSWDPEVFNITGMDVAEEFATTKPRIALSGAFIDNNGMTNVGINTGQMQPGEDKIVADRLYEVLTRKNEKPIGMAPAIPKLAGRWDVDIEFFSSKGRHSFTIEQDGNFISGWHMGTFTTREMYGIVDGNNVKLFSSERPSSNNVPFTFHGTATNNTMEGGIYMGEYLRAKFTAKRYEAPANPALNRPIEVPQGQPLSS